MERGQRESRGWDEVLAIERKRELSSETAGKCRVIRVTVENCDYVMETVGSN